MSPTITEQAERAMSAAHSEIIEQLRAAVTEPDAAIRADFERVYSEHGLKNAKAPRKMKRSHMDGYVDLKKYARLTHQDEAALIERFGDLVPDDEVTR